MVRSLPLALCLWSVALLLAVFAGRPYTALTTGLGPAALSAGNHHTCALTTGGGVKCWGENFWGRLGNGSTTNSATPVDVSGLTGGVAAVSVGGAHTCALTTSGGVTCWGYNGYGQLGDATTTSSSTPVAVSGLTGGVAAVSAGENHTCALTAGGGVTCWGWNFYGQLGDGTTTNSSTPVDVSGLTSGVVSISSGVFHTCALTAGGGVKCWGRNLEGQLGDGTATNSSTPVDVSGLGSGIAAVSAGSGHTCALTTGGGVRCWGRNLEGQLGNGTTADSATPVDVSGPSSGVGAISAGYYHTCALTTSGGALCWGRNVEGQLGDGSMANRTAPVDVSGLTSGVAAVSAGLYHSCARATGGGLKCWGGNGTGQLGDGTTAGSATPVDALQDTDSDGCLDGAESQTAPGSEATGGRRNPKSFWDFMDQYTGAPLARDRTVAVGDIGAVVSRFGTSGSATGDPLSAPGAATGYHTSADRNGSIAGQNTWNLRPPDGFISVGDIGAVVAQFGHSCA